LYPAQKHLPVLDGWRGISIACVLAGHMLPLGPKILSLNGMFATAGMSLFFILSGFLIVSMLWRNDHVISFLIRRVFRIVPLAWGFLIIYLTFAGASAAEWYGNLFFYANIPPFYLLDGNSHFWSLSVEMQFYFAIALAVALGGRYGLALVPVACFAVTAARIYYGVQISIVTWWRIDEILAGGCLALAFNFPRLASAAGRLPAMTPYLLAASLLASCHSVLGPLQYARPYCAALLIGSTIIRSEDSLQRLLRGRGLGYLAKISYALYVIHPITKAGWMGEGDVLVRYTKRIGSFIMTFLFAHLSTMYYEKYWIKFGHLLAARVEGRANHAAVASASVTTLRSSDTTDSILVPQPAPVAAWSPAVAANPSEKPGGQA
jgi:peptidoglycan/LPS O-acetylase OafA/YrhL